MKQTSNNKQNIAENEPVKENKLLYASPQLTTYGNIARFTQGSAGAKGDGGGGSQRA